MEAEKGEGALQPLQKNKKVEGAAKLAEEKHREVGGKCLGRGRSSR